MASALRPGLSALSIGALLALIIAEIAADDARLYEAQVADIHDQGRYLVEKKYRHLRMAYLFLGLAFLGGAIAQVIATIA